MYATIITVKKQGPIIDSQAIIFNYTTINY